MKSFSCIILIFCLFCTSFSRQLPPDSKLLLKSRCLFFHLLLGQYSCFITILVETDKQYATNPMPSFDTVGDCYINYVYLVSHYLTYKKEDLDKDEAIQDYFIVRNNYNDEGYLPFILSLLHSSTYTLIIKDGYFKNNYPDEAWITQAIQELKKNQNKDIATCHLEEIQDQDVHLSIPKGCLFFQSLLLRSIITRTEFRRNSVDPFFFMAYAYRCKFQSNIISVPINSYQDNNRLSSPKISIPHYSNSDITTNCEEAFQIQDINCASHRPHNNTIGVLLSQYKREYVYEQLEAIFHSSMSISDIIVYQNGIYRSYQNVFKKYPTIHHIWSTNWQSPFFLRHLLPLLFQTSYHIVFDDDIIPGPDTIKVLINTIDKYDAPSGVGGRIVESSNYRYGSYKQICVDCFNKKVTAVDFVIQVYAKAEIHSKAYWRYRPYTHRNGDDIHSSLSWFMECKKHPYRAVFSGKSAYKNYGSDSVASFKTTTHNIVRPQTYRSWIIGGYHGIKDSTVRKDYPRTLPKWESRHLSGVMRYF